MASRDKSQGFGFVYTNLSKILAERDNQPVDAHAPVQNAGAQSVNFNKDAAVPAARPVPTAEVQDRTRAISQIRENLDRLQSLHHKLHAMLHELGGVVDQKKKK